MNKHKAIISTIFLALLCATAFRHASANVTSHSASSGSSAIYYISDTPQFSQISSDGVRFLRHSHEPAACAAGLDGKATMTSTAQLCICDAENKQWRNMGTGGACAW